jgi:hypothetical protein
MLDNLDRDQHKALPRQRQAQSSASRKESTLLLQIPAHHCHYRSRPVGQLRNQHFMAIEETAFLPENPTTTASVPVEGQLFPLSARSSNSR